MFSDLSLHSPFTIFIEDRMRLGKAKIQKTMFFYLSLPSPFTIFIEDRMRFGNIKICKNFVFPFAIALTFHYLCIR